MGIPVHIVFSSPGELSRLLRIVNGLVAEGWLQSFRPKKAPAELMTLDALPIDGPWPDYFECYFTDANGDVYQLAAETYHGSGGIWRRLADPPAGN